MSKRRDQDYLGDICEAINRIRAYASEIDYEEFLGDQKTQDAVIRNLEIIGEAIKNLSNTVRKGHPQIPWKDLAGMRDKMIHHYFGLNYEIVWTIIKKELPQLLPQMKKILAEDSIFKT